MTSPLPPVFEASYRVHSYEADLRGRLRLFALLNYLQDAAGDHAARLHVAVSDLQRLGLTWVLFRYHVRLERFPLVGEKLQLQTWPSVIRGTGTLRDFRVRDAHGDMVACATSSWVLIDRSSKRPVTIADHLPDFPLYPERALASDFTPLDAVESPDLELPFRVRMADIDINRHVNNAVYVAWALESLPGDILDNALPEEVEVQFRAEAFHGDRILARTVQQVGGESPVFLHQLLREEDGRELTRLRSRWRQVKND